MKKVFKSNDFLIALLLVLVVSTCSFIAIRRGENLCSMAKSYQPPRLSGSSDAFWDVFPRQFVNIVISQ